MDHADGFYTLKGYQMGNDPELTSAMEDYLEMITRIVHENGYAKVGDLSKLLHVKPSSVTKMVQHLGENGFIRSEKYGDVFLTDKGEDAGAYLLYRHDVIHRFLCALNHSGNELEQVEKIEHFLDRHTVENLQTLTQCLTEGSQRDLESAGIRLSDESGE